MRPRHNKSKKYAAVIIYRYQIIYLIIFYFIVSSWTYSTLINYNIPIEILIVWIIYYNNVYIIPTHWINVTLLFSLNLRFFYFAPPPPLK